MSTLAPFAEFEQLLTSMCEERLSNATVQAGTAAPFGGRLDSVDALAFDAVAGASHMLRASTAYMQGWREGDTVRINGQDYRLASVPLRIQQGESEVALAIQRTGEGAP